MKKLTKPLSVSFFPAHSDDIMGPDDPMYPGSFDGMTGGLDPSNASGYHGSGEETEPPIPEGKTLSIYGRPVLAIGTYTVLIDPVTFPDEDMFETVATTLYDNGYNLARIWVLTAFRNTDLSPWANVGGVYQLDTLDATFMQRMDDISRIFTSNGVNVAWVLEDCWSIREGEDFHPMNPNNNNDPYTPKLMDSTAWTTEFGRQHWIFTDGKSSPAKLNLFTEVAKIAKKYNNLIYINSELACDPSEAETYRPLARTYTSMIVSHIRITYPKCIIGTSLMSGLYDIYKQVDLADLHGLGCDGNCNSGNIPQLAAAARSINPNVIVCMNNDGCMGGIVPVAGGDKVSRYGKDITAECALRSWLYKSFYEVKGEDPGPPHTWWPVAQGLLDGGRKARDPLHE